MTTTADDDDGDGGDDDGDGGGADDGGDGGDRGEDEVKRSRCWRGRRRAKPHLRRPKDFPLEAQSLVPSFRQ